MNKSSDDYSKEIAILEGAVDLHFHSGPSVYPRMFDHAGAVKEAADKKFKAVVLKDHYYPTYNGVYFVKKYIHADLPMSVYGGIALNNCIGGVNPYAVDVAAKAGAKIVWMPTVSSANHIVHHSSQKDDFKFPKSSHKLIIEEGITILDEKGQLKDEVQEVLEVLASFPEIILANGHLTYEETIALFKKAKEAGIQKLLVNHPTFLMECLAEDLKQLTALGAYIEHSAGMIHPDSIFYSISIDKLVHYIRTVGLDRTIISSDLGQVNNPLPVEGLLFTAKKLIDVGFSDNEIIQLFSKNAANLLGI